MEKKIQEKLDCIGQENGVRILFACEAGSRATGLSSPASDYDVRFIYVRPKNGYLTLEESRDVLEYPVSGDLDISGWDLKKALQLLYRSNPSLFEWFASPVVYRDSQAADQIRRLLPDYFSPEKSLRHYLSFAESNCRKNLTGGLIRPKKYFYMLRPVLACRWIREKGTQPPLMFRELAEAELPDSLKEETERLIRWKTDPQGTAEIEPVTTIDRFLNGECAALRTYLDSMQEDRRSRWQPLDDVFLSILDETAGDDIK